MTTPRATFLYRCSTSVDDRRLQRSHQCHRLAVAERFRRPVCRQHLAGAGLPYKGIDFQTYYNKTASPQAP